MAPSHVAASAFGHCLAMVGDEELAARLAAAALRRGGRRLATVLGHARHQALTHLAAHPAPPPALPPGAGAAEVAAALAASRPALERAVLDLSGRYQLGRGGLGVTLRMTPAAAAARVAAATRVWDTVLDPALLAWLGPGECDGMGAVLAGRDRSSVVGLLAAGEDVAAHAVGCGACGDRLRSMASVRLLATRAPLPAPPASVVAAAGSARLQPPALPPPLEAPGRPRFRRVAAVVAAVAAVAALVAVGTAVAPRGDGGAGRRAAVDALTRVAPAAGGLRLSPPVLDLATRELVVANHAARPLEWTASADVEWIEVTPARGRLAPGEARTLRVRVLDTAPEGEVRASVRVVGDDASATASPVVGSVEHPPDLGAEAEGCHVAAMAEDEGDVALTLHWRDATGEQHGAMSEQGDRWAGALPPGRPLTWWVRAVDGRGNQARTADMALPAGC